MYAFFNLLATIHYHHPCCYYSLLLIYLDRFFKAKLSLLPGVTAFRNFAMHPDDEPDEIMTTAQHVIDELRPLFDGCANKNELILALQLQLKKYN